MQLFRLLELHGPNYWSIHPGWLIKPLKSQSNNQTKYHPNQHWVDWVSLEFGGLCLKSDLDFAIRLAQKLIDPFKLHESPLFSNDLAIRDSHRIIQCQAHDLAGIVLKLALKIIALSLQENSPAESKITPKLNLAIMAVRDRAKSLSSHSLTNKLIDQALQRGLPWRILEENFNGCPILQIGTGTRGRLLYSSSTDKDWMIGGSMCRDKAITCRILKQLGYRTPKQKVLPIECSQKQLINAISSVGYPCVLKPRDAEQGQGVTTRIENQSSLINALHKAKAAAKSGLLLEEHVSGDYHRLVILNGHLKRVRLYQPPHLIADGRHSIQETLENAKEIDPKSVGIFCYGTPPPLNQKMIQHLKTQGLLLDSIPAAGTKVELLYDLIDRNNWYDLDLLEKVDISLVRMSEDIAKAFGMENLGIDILTIDITKPLIEQQLNIIELNAVQVLHPSAAAMMLQSMFPDQASSRIEISVTVCASKKDWPNLAKINSLLTNGGNHTLAIPNRLKQNFDPQCLAKLSKERAFIFYSDPKEVLFNRSIESLYFLIDWQEFIHSGLPSSQIDHLQLLGKPEASLASRWDSLMQLVPIRKIDVNHHHRCDLLFWISMLMIPLL